MVAIDVGRVDDTLRCPATRRHAGRSRDRRSGDGRRTRPRGPRGCPPGRRGRSARRWTGRPATRRACRRSRRVGEPHRRAARPSGRDRIFAMAAVRSSRCALEGRRHEAIRDRARKGAGVDQDRDRQPVRRVVRDPRAERPGIAAVAPGLPVRTTVPTQHRRRVALGRARKVERQLQIGQGSAARVAQRTAGEQRVEEPGRVLGGRDEPAGGASPAGALRLRCGIDGQHGSRRRRWPIAESPTVGSSRG